MGSYGRVHRGLVRQIEDGQFRVELPALNPGRLTAPLAATVTGIAVDDVVLVASVGIARDALVIIGRLPAKIDITDVLGLQTALNGKADDAEITALDSRLDTAEASLVSLDSRLDTAEASLVSLDGRLDTAEASLTAYDGRLDSLEAAQHKAFSCTSGTRPAHAEGLLIYETDTGHVLVSTGSAWRMLNIPALADPDTLTAVYPHMLAIDTTALMLQRYNGVAWVDVLPLGGTTTATRHDCFHYQSGTAQVIPTGTLRRVNFNSNVDQSADFTFAAHASGGSEITVNRAGLIAIETNSRFASSSVSGTERYLALINSTTPATRYANDSDTPGGPRGASLSCGTSRRFAVGDKLAAAVYQDTGGDLSLDTGYGQAVNISLVWLRP